MHRKISHPDAYTLSVDLSGKMTAGYDQGHQRCRYMMVACYTVPVTGDGAPLLEPPGHPPTGTDHPLPSMDLHGGDVPGPDQVPPDVWPDDDIVMMDQGGDEPPIPEDPADIPQILLILCKSDHIQRRQLMVHFNNQSKEPTQCGIA